MQVLKWSALPVTLVNVPKSTVPVAVRTPLVVRLTTELIRTDQYISFLNPDQSVVVVGMNAGGTLQHLSIEVDGIVVANAALPPHSFNTFKVPSSNKQQQ